MTTSDATQSTGPAPRAGRREWIGLAVIALPCLLYSMDLTVLNLALPSISRDLKPSSAQLLWIVDVYGFLVAGSLITMGTLGDRIGRRRLLLMGAAAFGVASVLAAFSTSAEMLIATRALLGIAGATLAPSTLSLIRNMFLDPHQRTVAIGVWVTSYSIGGAIGPLLGGILLQYFWWGSVFLIAVPVMLLLLVLAPILLPEFRDPKAGRLDVYSAALSLAAVLGVIYGLKRMAESGPGWVAALAVLSGLAVGMVFLRRQKTLADPLIDLRLFRAPAFSASLATYTLGTFVAFGAYIFIAQYLQLVLGLSPLRAGHRRRDRGPCASDDRHGVSSVLFPRSPRFQVRRRPGGANVRARMDHDHAAACKPSNVRARQDSAAWLGGIQPRLKDDRSSDLVHDVAPALRASPRGP